MTRVKLAILYARVSTAGQIWDDYSLRRQSRPCEGAEAEGYEMLEAIEDP